MIHYAGGDGTTLETAIKIMGAEIETDGIEAEYFIINLCFEIIEKKYSILFQELYHIGDKSFDRIVLKDEDGMQRDLWFEITDFYGKW